MQLFVPGRICLFGEHSDWAGGYRRINADIEKGYAIITGTNQGLYAEVRPHPNKFIFRPCLPDGTRPEPYEAPMERSELLRIAQEGGFFSYAAGVAYQVMTHYRVRGLEIDNYRTDLPVKKGLSSSAAVCVLTARAFNQTYDLKLTTRGEMEIAYMGEITTPSRCGRLDQGCAYGNRPVMLVFDGDRIDVRELAVHDDLHMVIVDLHGSKDTVEILGSLNHCYPFAENEQHRKVQNYLGPLNRRIVENAAPLLQDGDSQQLGLLMKEAQAQFDENVTPACPSQLKAPKLHWLLAHPAIQPFIYGGKGVGSQGDGTAQLICRDAAAQEQVCDIINKELQLSSLKLSITAARRVRKALIPAAGFGTRLFPATKALKKELFPVIDRDGRAKPVILAIVEEALSAGIEEIAILVQPSDKALFEEIFCMPPPIEHYNKLSADNRKYCDRLMEIGHHITLLTQEQQEGFGHAVYCAREWVQQEPFLLLLGDHLYHSNTAESCAAQLVKAYEYAGRSVVGLMTTPLADVQHFGCATGLWKEPGRLLDITEFAEKPDREYAEENLAMEGLPDGERLTVFGQYILSPRIFELLEEQISSNVRERGEFQLTSCLEKLRREDGFTGCLVDGRRFDIGYPAAYRNTVIEFGKA